MQNKFLITKFIEPEETMYTQYGWVTNGKWLDLEAQRIEKAGGLKCEIVRDKNGRRALAYVECEEAEQFIKETDRLCNDIGLTWVEVEKRWGKL